MQTYDFHLVFDKQIFFGQDGSKVSAKGKIQEGVQRSKENEL